MEERVEDEVKYYSVIYRIVCAYNRSAESQDAIATIKRR